MKKFLYGVAMAIFALITMTIKIALPVITVWVGSLMVRDSFSWFPEIPPLAALGGLFILWMAGRFWFSEDPFGFRDEDDQE